MLVRPDGFVNVELKDGSRCPLLPMTLSTKSVVAATLTDVLRPRLVAIVQGFAS